MSHSRVLYLVACAAPPVRVVARGVRAAQEAGWEVCVILTPSAHRWLDAASLVRLTDLTGHPVRYRFKLPDEHDALPPPDALLVAPATLNTLTKWADGHADTLAVALVTEGIGMNLPMVTLPYVNAAQAAHPAFDRAVETLRRCGVSVLLGEGGHVPHPPRHGDVATYPWRSAIGALPSPVAELAVPMV